MDSAVGWCSQRTHSGSTAGRAARGSRICVGPVPRAWGRSHRFESRSGVRTHRDRLGSFQHRGGAAEPLSTRKDHGVAGRQSETLALARGGFGGRGGGRGGGWRWGGATKSGGYASNRGNGDVKPSRPGVVQG